MSRTPILAGNWKMFKTIAETTHYLRDLIPLVEGKSRKIYIAPSFPSLFIAAELAKGTNVRIGAQNIHDVEEGGYTGEVSAKMVKEAGASFVILGHSERRRYFHEDDAFIHRKVRQALKHSLEVIFCFGETGEERESGKTKEVLEKQIHGALHGLTDQEMKNVILAYEPVWAIGTGKTATPAMAEEAHEFCRSLLSKLFTPHVAKETCILYGGSVTPDTISLLMAEEDIDGALVGGASLKVESFSKIINY